MKFYKAWNYLENHCIFKDENGISRFQECLGIEIVKVDPTTNSISDDEVLNTKTRVWLEAGPYFKGERTHYCELDCGARTFEKAIVKLAKKVKKHFGDDKVEALKKVNSLYGEDTPETKENSNKI